MAASLVVRTNDHHKRKKLYGSSCVDIKKILAVRLRDSNVFICYKCETE